MAVGIPKGRKKALEAGDIKNIPVHLSYEGKTDEVEILKLPYSPSIKIRESKKNDKDNRLYQGDNLDVLLELLNDPKVKGEVKLVYIDPPFASKSTFKSRSNRHAYHDFMDGGQYIEELRKRLIILRELLASDGSIYVHLDNKMAFHMKIIMDEIFGEKNFRAFISRRKCSNKNFTRLNYGNITDYILFYSKNQKYIWNRPYESWDEENMIRQYPCVDEKTGKRYKKVPIHAPGTRNGATGGEWRGMLPPKGKHWQYLPEKLDEMDRRGEIYWSPTGNPRRKVFFEDSKGIPKSDIWLNYRDLTNQNTETTGYPTEKNLQLLIDIVSTSSNENDLVLDCYCGSGTTLFAANKLNRRWIGVDIGDEAIKATIKRLNGDTDLHGDYVNKRKQKNKQLTFTDIKEQAFFSLFTNDTTEDS
ncbi:MAG: site-specific DNA-methyltransferase [Bacillota bacterium]|nr:site-specific DNA-methyltransferase [Bacillota bacterium]